MLVMKFGRSAINVQYIRHKQISKKNMASNCKQTNVMASQINIIPATTPRLPQLVTAGIVRIPDGYIQIT